jgi:hypothetical protein
MVLSLQGRVPEVKPHISPELVGTLTFVFAITSVLSTISSLTITKSNANSPGCWKKLLYECDDPTDCQK